MPCGLGRTKSNLERAADRRSRTLFKRSLDQINCKFSSKDRQVPSVVLRNSEERCIILLVAPEPDAYWLVPFSPPLQGADRRNSFGSGAPSDLEGLESLTPPPAIIFQVNLRNEQKKNMLEHADSPRSISACSSSGSHGLWQSQHRTAWAKPLKNSSSTSLPSCLVSDISSGSVSDGLSAVGSDFLVNDIPKMEGTAKRSSRKKGKKKGKKYRRATCKKVSVEKEIKCEGSTGGSSVSEISVNEGPTGSNEHVLGTNFSARATSPRSSVNTEKDDSENNTEFNDCSTTLMSCTSYSDETDDSEPLPLSQEIGGEESNCSSTTCLNDASSTSQAPEKVLSSDEKTENIHQKQNKSCYDSSPSTSLDTSTASVADSFVNGWSSDISENCKEETEINSSEGGMASDSRNPGSSCHITLVNLADVNTDMSNDCCISESYWSKDVTDTIQRAQHGSQACSSNDFCPVICGKRNRRSRRYSGSLNGANRFVSGSIHGRTGKDNNHPVWQKVQKLGAEDCLRKPKNINVVSGQNDVSVKDSETRMGLPQSPNRKSCRYPCPDEVIQADSGKVSSNAANSSELLSKSTAGNSVTNSKRKPTLAPKEAHHISRNGTCKNNIARASKSHVSQKEGLQVSLLTNHNKCLSTGLRSVICTDSDQSLVKSTNKNDCRASETQQKIKVHMDEAAPPGNRSTGCNVGLPFAENNGDLLLSALDSSDKTLIEVNSESSAKSLSDIHEELTLRNIGNNQCVKSEIENVHAESSKLDTGTGPVLQKWVPIGRKNSTVSTMSHVDYLKCSILDESIQGKSESKNTEVVVLSSNTHHQLPLIRGGFPCSSFDAKDKNFSLLEADESNSDSKLKNSSNLAGEFGGVLAVSDPLEMKGKSFLELETDLDKIMQVVCDTSKIQTASEGINLVTGCPIADFEKFLYSAAPVVGQMPYNKSCMACCQEQVIGDSLCRHQIPNVSLRTLWQWYEEPGCYGLEVKARDNRKARSLHGHCFEFNAYFVPYLSAVQLFGRSRNSRNGNRGNREARLVLEMEKTSRTSSNLHSLPIFSKLLPQPGKEMDSCALKSSSFSAIDELPSQSVGSTDICDGELIFEYFESDQPPSRRPLFEKIKELVSIETLPDCRIYGDPMKLECMNLHDLHPASWYSVAWYPIYRIPDGNFRAAFLSYHSLGHFVSQSSSTNVPRGGCIVCPVVGLQTYNDKGECWFQLKNSDSKVLGTEDASYSNPSEILKERLRTLKLTASVMARAAVSKGNQRSVNRHPDYEFFLSRSW